MVWTYRDPGAWGGGVGRKLTVLEGDNNTWETQQRIEALEAAIYMPVGIADVTVVGSTWSLLMTDGSIQGPFVMPTTVLRPRGYWLPTTIYAGLDLVVVPGLGLYLVMQSHTSEATFNPALQIGGTDVYGLIIDTSILAGVATISASTHTPPIAQAGYHYRCTNPSGCIITLPSFATTPIPVRTVYQWEQQAAGQLQFFAGSGATVNKPPTRDVLSAEQYAVVAAIKVATNEWTLAGYLSALEV